MFWIYFLIVFVVLAGGWIYMMRRRGPGGGESGVDNHNATLNAEAKFNAQHISNQNHWGGPPVN